MDEMNVLAQSNNEVVVEGILSEVDLKEAKTDDGREYIRGSIIVSVDQEVEKEQEHEDVKIDLIAMKYKKDGNANPAYKSIKDVLLLRRISTDGIDAADRVRVRGIRVEESVYQGQDGNRVFTWKLQGSFVSKVQGEFKPRAVFQNEIYLRSIDDEVVNGEETGRLVLKGFAVGFRNRLDLLTYVVGLPKAVDYIRKNWDTDTTVHIEGYVRNRFVNKAAAPAEEADGFGEAVDFGGSAIQRELVVTRGGVVDRGWEEDDLRRAAAVREERIENDIAKQKAKAAKKSNASAAASAPAKKAKSW